MANNKVAPVFYSKQSSQHLPMEDGMLIDSKFIESGSLISSDAGNLITEGSDGGIRLTASDLICDAGNCDNLLQTCDDGKIFVERPNIVSKQDGNLISEDRADGSAMLGFGDVVSSDGGNIISQGSDGKIFADRPNIVSKQDGNLITEDRADGSAMLGFGDIVSTDKDNLLSKGTDDKLFVESPNIVSKQDGNLLTEDRSDGSAMLGFDDAVSKDKNNLISEGTDGKLSVIGEDIVSDDRANLIKVTDGGRIEFTVDDMLSDVECNVLDVDKDGRVKLCLGMEYDIISGKMNLTGNDGAVIDSVTIPSAASVLESVELVKDPAGVGDGYFLKLVFITTAERRLTIYADMNSLSDIYKGGKGIEITNGYTINVKLGSDPGLMFDTNGGLKVSADVVRRPELDSYAKKSDIPDLSSYAKKSDIPVVPVHVGGSGISYKESTSGGVKTGTIAADLHLEAVKSGNSKMLRIVDADGNLIGKNSVVIGSGLEVENDGKAGTISATGYTLESHAVSTSKYGAGTGSLYGHVKLTDSASQKGTDGNTADIDDGFAVTPKALAGILTRLTALEDAPDPSSGPEIEYCLIGPDPNGTFQSIAVTKKSKNITTKGSPGGIYTATFNSTGYWLLIRAGSSVSNSRLPALSVIKAPASIQFANMNDTDTLDQSFSSDLVLIKITD